MLFLPIKVGEKTHDECQTPDIEKGGPHIVMICDESDDEWTKEKACPAYCVDHGNAHGWGDIFLPSSQTVYDRNQTGYAQTCNEKSCESKIICCIGNDQ